MADFDIDNLKKQWQQQNATSQYASEDIRSMLNRKSRNYIKYILYISIVESILVFLLNAYDIIYDNGNDNIIQIVNTINIAHNETLDLYFNSFYWLMKIGMVITTFYFIFKFYKSYKRINIEENLKNFILQIISFKRTVNTFIIFNIAWFVLVIILIFFFVLSIVLQSGSQGHRTEILAIGLFFLAMLCIGTFIAWLYYKIVYGFIIGRLKRNLEQLKEIDAEPTP